MNALRLVIAGFLAAVVLYVVAFVFAMEVIFYSLMRWL